ncbi:MAG: hypothetical protein C5B58_07425 [Acidobacteria bacterium]|nr:MAG: hypothetical protein C5B58_07425 [Acidobacteriota bacterium]
MTNKPAVDDSDPREYPPRRYIDKKEGVRHILHAAIRAVVAGEDPFAIHLLGQSAEKVLIDLLKNEGAQDPFYSLLKPEMRDEFFAIYRESYNFLKHADRDSDGKLGVHSIVESNDLLLFTSVARYGVLFGAYTAHMSVFLKFAGLLYPGIIDWDQWPNAKTLLEGATRGSLTRGEATAVTRLAMQQNQECQREAQQDLDDVALANSTKVEERWRQES